MTNYNIEMVETFLRFEISEKYSRIRSFARQSKINYNLAINEIYKKFAMGSKGDLSTYRAINEHIGEKKSYARYNYFDLATLYSFNTYLSEIISKSGYMGLLDAIDASVKNMVQFKNQKESGFYDADNPILPRLDVDGRFAPVKTLERGELERKYGYVNCQKELEKYEEGKTGEKKNTQTSAKANSKKKPEVSLDRDGNKIKPPVDPDQLRF